MNKLFYCLISAISLVLFVLAPKEYSYSFNVAVLVLYCVDYIVFSRKEKIKALSYPSLFFFIYFFVNFAYPIFIYPFDATFIIQFRYSFSPDYINSGSAMSLTAFSMFISGYANVKTKKKIDLEERNSHTILNVGYYKIFSAISVLVLLYNLFLIVPQIGISYGDAIVPFQSGSLFVMLESALTLLLCHNNRQSMRDNTKKFFSILWFHTSLCVAFSGASLLLGSREYILTLSLLYCFLYAYYVRPIKAWQMLVGLIIGTIALYVVSQVRSNNVQITSSKEVFELKPWQNGRVSGAWNIATDLIINNRNVYVGMQYVDDPKHGYSYGYNYIPNLLSPIPFLPSLFTEHVLRTTVVDLTSQQMLTNYTRDELGDHDLDYELGSNCVVDVYMAFGIFGVILFFFGLGVGIKKLENRLNSDDVKSVCLYLVLFTGLVFFCRSSFLGPLKNLIWAYWLCCICLKKRYTFVHQKSSLLTQNTK